ncbi:hypothetical protein C8A05DRAFT_34247 [Staphylotrichum tortipilum]|uniref:HMG box domain-containing protein n=1 Tax=Staphylotrichum tortipilum TaxID=2831512 RepID=A0AAN6MKR5_9PEZI|nr:hypothetical protein C8A05DRAFT_34247 [Staphylotrichum longicolle]
MAPATSVPPALPPSVEEAYRRKCIQLKQRTNEVEDANDAARLRLSRLKRQVEKMRLERAFLLEQLAKRTSTNVEDSDGSPSPPPTPKEKPLRIKRGHRKPSAFPNLEATSSVNAATPGSTTFISQNRLVHSPSSDAFSAQPGDAGKTNGAHKGSAAPKKPGSAFSLFCDDTRPSLLKEGDDEAKEGDDEAKDGDDEVKEGDDEAKEGDDATTAAAAVEDELSTRWKALPESERDDYQSRADQQMAEYKKEKEAYDEAVAAKAKEEAVAAKAKEADDDKAAESTAEAEKEEESRPPQPQAQQEDVEMTNYDTDQETQGEKPEE